MNLEGSYTSHLHFCLLCLSMFALFYWVLFQGFLISDDEKGESVRLTSPKVYAGELPSVTQLGLSWKTKSPR